MTENQQFLALLAAIIMGGASDRDATWSVGAAQLATELYLDIGAEGSLDVHFESVNEAYQRGQLEGILSGCQNGLDVGIKAGPGTVHTDPDSLS